MGDPIGNAIAAAANPRPPAQVKVKMTTGREALLVVPFDLQAQEALDLVGYIARQLPGTLAANQGSVAPLVIARGNVPRA